MDGQQLAPADLTDDLVADILRQAKQVHAHDGAEPLSEQARLRLRYRGQATHLVVPGRAYVQLAVVGEGVEAEGFVVPSARGSGLGRELTDRVTTDVRTSILAWAHGDAPAAARLAARAGAERIRELLMMSRDTSPVDAPEVPDGITLRSFEPGRDDRGWLAVNADAFADHPEQGRWTEVDLQERMAQRWFDPAGLIVAVDNQGIVGFHWTKIIDDVGEVYVVGVSPRAQGMGLGRVLTRAGLRHMVASGVSRIDLYVDGDNTAATHLYRSLGFEVSAVDVQYALVR